MFDSLIVDVAIGLVFTFASTAALTSALTEAVARFIGLRGDYLLRGIRALVDGSARKASMPAAPIANQTPISASLLESPLLRSTGSQDMIGNTAGGVSGGRNALRQLPSYISSHAFASAVIDLVIPTADGDTTMAKVITGIESQPPGIFKDSLLAIAKAASSDVDKFRAGVESWYDNHMDRVSGWYKRHTRWISLAVGTIIVLVFNVNAVTIARDLYTDQALRESVVTQAFAKAQCQPDKAADCIADARKELANLRSDGLPIGWGEVAACQPAGARCGIASKIGLASPSRNGGSDVLYFLGVVIGLVITAFALTPGARFWFDLLSKLGSLRSSGPKPQRGSQVSQ